MTVLERIKEIAETLVLDGRAQAVFFEIALHGVVPFACPTSAAGAHTTRATCIAVAVASGTVVRAEASEVDAGIQDASVGRPSPVIEIEKVASWAPDKGSTAM